MRPVGGASTTTAFQSPRRASATTYPLSSTSRRPGAMAVANSVTPNRRAAPTANEELTLVDM